MKDRRGRLTAVCFFILFLLGFEAGGFQISLLKIMEAEGFSSGLSGVLVSGQYGAIIIMPLLVGGFADRRGKRRVLTASCLIFALVIPSCLWSPDGVGLCHWYGLQCQ